MQIMSLLSCTASSVEILDPGHWENIGPSSLLFELCEVIDLHRHQDSINLCLCFFVRLSFWKCGSRKIYAVRVTTHVPLKRSAKSKAKASYSSCYDISDDSDEDFTPKKTRGDSHGDIQIVNSQINEVKSMVSDILKVNQILSLPLGVVKLIRDAFICKICLSTPMKPPVITSKCCNSLIGSEECVNHWYDGADGLRKKCPHCNEPRGYASTFQFKGLDEFLVGVRKLIKSDESNASD